MIVFILMSVKFVATLFQLSDHTLRIFSAISVPTLFVWATDDSGVELLAFKSAFWFVLFAMYLLVWIVTPWLTLSNRRVVTIVGLSFVAGLNLLDMIGCMLSALSPLEKTLSSLFSVLIILLSLRTILKGQGGTRGRF